MGLNPWVDSWPYHRANYLLVKIVFVKTRRDVLKPAIHGPIVKFTTSIHPQPTGFPFWYCVQSMNYIFTHLVYQQSRPRVLAEHIDDVEKILDSLIIF